MVRCCGTNNSNQRRARKSKLCSVSMFLCCPHGYVSYLVSLSLSLFTFPSQLEIIKAIQGHKISLKCDCRITNYSVEIRSCISYSDMYISYQYIYMIMILDCFSQKRICSEKYWFKELIILLFHSFFFPFSSEPLWKLLQSDHLQPALLPFFLLSLPLHSLCGHCVPINWKHAS